MRKERGNTVSKELFKFGFYIFLFVSVCLQIITSYFIQPKYGGPQEINLGFILLVIPLVVEWVRGRSPLEYYGVRSNLLFSWYSIWMIIIGIGVFVLFFLFEEYVFHIFRELAKHTSTYAPGGG